MERLLLDEQLILHPAQLPRQAHCLCRVHRTLVLQQAREDELTAQRINGGRQRLFSQRIKRGASAVVQFRVPDGHKPGHEQAAFRPPDKGIADRLARTVVRHKDDAPRQRHPVSAMK